MGDTGSDIIIKGGSVELSYDEPTYPQDNGDPKAHKNANKKITRVTISGGGLDFDSGEHQGGLLCTITISCR
jgi:hypothetical protein